MQVCEAQEMKLFCKDYVEKAEVMFIFATISSLLIILSLVSFVLSCITRRHINWVSKLIRAIPLCTSSAGVYISCMTKDYIEIICHRHT